MKKTAIISVLTVLFLSTALVGVSVFYAKNRQKEIRQSLFSEKIRLFAPLSGAKVKSPLAISGEARGFWYFEASFPVHLLDADGKEVATSLAQAESDWMTEEFVPFKSVITFQNPETETGFLIFKRDNPSGLPEHDEEIRIPITFDPAMAKETEKIKLKVYFNNTNFDPEASCNKVFAVEREVQKTTAPARAAVSELLKGPTSAEKENGFLTSIGSGVMIQKLNIENGVAKIDFNDELEYQVGGSCRVSAIRAQIIETLQQFSTVNNVIISINGRTEDILQP